MTVVENMGLLSQAMRDENGQGDIAYISVAWVTMAAIGSAVFVCVMSVIDYWTCAPVTTITQGGEKLTSVVPCRFDPLPLGQALGLIFAAYAALLGALAGYMAATRRRERGA